jgi:hypothetical protein
MGDALHIDRTPVENLDNPTATGSDHASRLMV